MIHANIFLVTASQKKRFFNGKEVRFMESERKIRPGQGRILDSIDDPRFPKVVGRTRRIPTVEEIATVIDESGQPVIDRGILRSVLSMEGME